LYPWLKKHYNKCSKVAFMIILGLVSPVMQQTELGLFPISRKCYMITTNYCPFTRELTLEQKIHFTNKLASKSSYSFPGKCVLTMVFFIQLLKLIQREKKVNIT